MSFRPSHIPLRLITGAFILNSGLGKTALDEGTAGFMQSMASKGFPQASQLEPAQFGKILAASEIAVGSALLAPFIPSKLAGLGLLAFSAGLMTMYFRTPEMTEDDGIRPTQDGITLAKDSWMVAIALALIIDGKKKRK
ncbi:DoxX family membrane protein [Arthrobacter echini]|uniref:DoxX family membrane protein n=1 Tax=Arthrobacter echini TaxID=1529066 RepID=A0A4S5E8F8_9MICC|nr:DoxX family membrane protein [Arthrobacter echini]THJ67946.1 DoxX family membrane protein [Arthrobacter echini]